MINKPKKTVQKAIKMQTRLTSYRFVSLLKQRRLNKNQAATVLATTDVIICIVNSETITSIHK